VFSCLAFYVDGGGPLSVLGLASRSSPHAVLPRHEPTPSPTGAASIAAGSRWSHRRVV